MEIFDQVGNDNGAESSEKECANLFKHKPFMDLYLINAATDAKRQARLGDRGDANWRRKAPQCNNRACYAGLSAGITFLNASF